MSEDRKVDTYYCCASCGTAEVDDVKLRECSGCDLVRYCSDACQRDHKLQHEEACKERAAELRDELLFKQPEGTLMGDCPICMNPLSLYLERLSLKSCCSKVICRGCDRANLNREFEMRLPPSCPFCRKPCRHISEHEDEEDCKKRAAELRDELLFKQPESTHLEDCPICSLPLPLDMKKCSTMQCCSKVICNGCQHAHLKRQIEMRIEETCPFCREAMPETYEEAMKLRMKRIEANDPVAICSEASARYNRGEYSSAIEYFTRAADLGDIQARYRLSMMYCDDFGVENDKEKYIHHAEKAAIAGHPGARYNLGRHEWGYNWNPERAVKHWIISATHGCNSSIKYLIDMFKKGFLTKEDLAVTLRAHHAAVDATKSPQRKEAEDFYRGKGLM